MSDTAMAMTPAQAYEQYRRLLLKLAWGAHQRFGGDLEELIAEANYHFMRVFHSYDPERAGHEGRKAQMITLIYRYVLNGLRKTLVRRGYIRNGPHLRRTYIRLDQLPARETTSRLDRILREVSDEAREVVRLALTIRPRTGRSNGTKRTRAIGLLKEAGWTMRQLMQAFTEVREALAG